jgi:hypothetical protein
LQWYKSFLGTTSAKDAGMKNMVQKYAGAACTVLYVQVILGGAGKNSGQSSSPYIILIILT